MKELEWLLARRHPTITNRADQVLTEDPGELATYLRQLKVIVCEGMIKTTYR